MSKPIISGNKITIPSNTEYLNDVDIFIEGIVRGYGADESVTADIAISISELVNNAIAHGNKVDPDTLVTVEISRKDRMVSICVTDQGGGFDPDEIDDPLADENLLKEVGRGIFIVKSLMDKVDIEPTEHGTAVTISKTI